MPASERELADIAAQLASAVREAGALALSMFTASLKHWTKGASSPVSEADIAIDLLLNQRLLATGPDYGWLSEETEDDRARLDKRCVWVVDPIDGTRAYIAGLPDWAVSAALVEDGRPVAAAVFAPAANELLCAVAGGGATCNGHPITTSAGEDFDGARIAGPPQLLQTLAAARPGVIVVPRVRSLALRFARVAQGTLDAALSSAHSHDWDLAAADLLVHEADGALTTFAGERILYNGPESTHGPLIAAGRMRHRALRDLLRAQQSSLPPPASAN